MKAWLSDHGIQYTVRDVRSDPSAQAEFLRRGYLLPPVVALGGLHVSGYEPASLAAMLGTEV